METQELKNGSYFDEEDQTTKWFKDGIIHREDGPAIISPNGNQAWYQNGVFHRVGGPALEMADENMYQWCQNGLLHREDGPAVMMKDIIEWWIHGVQYSEKEFNALKLNEKLEAELPQENIVKIKKPKL
jgi:hypothetical protein